MIIFFDLLITITTYLIFEAWGMCNNLYNEVQEGGGTILQQNGYSDEAYDDAQQADDEAPAYDVDNPLHVNEQAYTDSPYDPEIDKFAPYEGKPAPPPPKPSRQGGGQRPKAGSKTQSRSAAPPKESSGGFCNIL